MNLQLANTEEFIDGSCTGNLGEVRLLLILLLSALCSLLPVLCSLLSVLPITTYNNL